jgi:LacI family transcriptional regulator
MISGPRGFPVWESRQRGYEDALKGFSLESNIAEAGEERDIRSGHEAMRKLMSGPMPPDAVFTGNDWYAMGAYFYLGEKGLRAGKDISVIGFDDLDFAATLMPPLTTVSVGMEEIGKRAVKALAERIQNPDSPVRREIIMVKITERQSCVRNRITVYSH